MKKHIPNTITCLNLISGCIATYWAFQGDYRMALLFIVIGAVFDFFDGMVARLGLPTPANALFWGALIVGLGDKIATLPYAPWLVLATMLVSSWLLVSEIPMFALKFKTWGWQGNQVKYLFLLSCIPLLLLLGISGIAAIIAWYILLSVVTQSKA